MLSARKVTASTEKGEFYRPIEAASSPVAAIVPSEVVLHSHVRSRAQSIELYEAQGAVRWEYHLLESPPLVVSHPYFPDTRGRFSIEAPRLGCASLEDDPPSVPSLIFIQIYGQSASSMSTKTQSSSQAWGSYHRCPPKPSTSRSAGR